MSPVTWCVMSRLARASNASRHSWCDGSRHIYLGTGNASLGCALFQAQVSCYSTQLAENKVTFLIEFGAWEDVDLSLEFGKVVAVRRFSCWRPLQFLGKFPDSDPRLPMLQIAKKVVPCSAQELYKMRPEPKKVCTLMRHITLHVTEYMMYMSTRPKFQVQLSVMLLVN